MTSDRELNCLCVGCSPAYAAAAAAVIIYFPLSSPSISFIFLHESMLLHFSSNESSAGLSDHTLISNCFFNHIDQFPLHAAPPPPPAAATAAAARHTWHFLHTRRQVPSPA